MNNPILHQSDLDVIALETKHQEDYERACAVEEFCKHYKDEPRTTFEDGKYDGELDIEPEPYQWFDPYNNKINIFFNKEKTTTTELFCVVK